MIKPSSWFEPSDASVLHSSMQNLVSEAEPQDSTKTLDKRRSDSLQHDQGRSSKRSCTRQAGAVAPAGGSDKQASQHLQQQQDNISASSVQFIHSSQAQQQSPQQQQAECLLSPGSVQQLGWEQQGTQQSPWQSQQGDADAVVSVRVVSHKGAHDQVGT
jgi:hypothetical protein